MSDTSDTPPPKPEKYKNWPSFVTELIGALLIIVAAFVAFYFLVPKENSQPQSKKQDGQPSSRISGEKKS